MFLKEGESMNKRVWAIPFFTMKHLELQSRNIELQLPKVPFDIVAYAFLFYLVPLFQNESSCRTFHMKITLIFRQMNFKRDAFSNHG